MKRTKKSPLALSTRAIHGSRTYPFRGPVATPIVQTSTYRFASSKDAIRYARGDESVYVYTRYHNPTVREVEDRLALMEGGETAALFSSGMAAISSTILAFCGKGDEIVSTPSLYGGTYRFFRDTLPQYGISVRYLDPRSLEDMLYLITPKTRIVYLETPTNPTLAIFDIAKLVNLTRKIGKEFGPAPRIVIDNTFATILNQQPFSFGVDIILESSTKYLGGHNDLLGGAAIGRREDITKIRALARHLGGCADPFAAFLLERSLKTFALRVERQTENAIVLARALQRHPKISRVIYPGLPSHPQHRLAKKQMSGFGAMVTIEVRGGVRAAVRLCDRLRIAVNAMSLGGVQTLVSIPVYSSHVKMSAKELSRHGVTPGMVRISVGIEAVEDVIRDFREALAKV